MISIYLNNMGTREATRDALEGWIENSPWLERLLERIFAKTLSKAYAEGYAIGVQQIREEGLAKAQDWHNRRQAALEKGEPFDEPPPWDDKS